MSRPFARLRQFFGELKRRNVYRVAATYAMVGFVLIQAADLIFPALNIPSWAYSLVVVLILFGFPIALVLAWAFEMTPEGVRRTREAEPAGEEGSGPGEGLSAGYKVLVGLGLVAATFAGGWYLTRGGGETPEISEGTVAVLPFHASGTGAEDWRGAMVSLLTTNLDGAAEIRTIADRTVVSEVKEQGFAADDMSTEEALKVARGRRAIRGSRIRFAGRHGSTTDGPSP